MFKFALFASLSIGMATAVHADTTQTGPVLVAPTGKVLVNLGQGFVPASDGLALNFKDQIMVGKDAAVTLAYAKCSLVLKQGTMLTLPKGDLCGKTADATLASSNVLRMEPADDTDFAGAPANTVGLTFVGSLLAIGGFMTISNACPNAVSKC
ncbi:MAG: hypothetical protein ABI230_05680 [Aestuariivirga sp.]